MKKFSFLLVAFTLLALSGCQKEYENVSTTEVPSDDTIELVDGSIAGSIIDQDGKKIDGATVQIIVNGTVLHETKTQEGNYVFNDVSLSPIKNLIKAFSDAHSSNYSTLLGADSELQLVNDIQIVQNDRFESFDINSNINFVGRSIFVNIPSGTLTNDSEDIRLSAKYYNFTHESRALYGIRDALNEDGTIQKANFSHGVYVMAHHSTGQEAEVKEGFSYEIRFAAPYDNSPSEIDVWYFDEKEIIWKKKHVASLTDDRYLLVAEEFGHFAVKMNSQGAFLTSEIDTAYIDPFTCESKYSLPELDVEGGAIISWESSHKEGEFASGDVIDLNLADSPVRLTVYVTLPDGSTSSQEMEVQLIDNIVPVAICNDSLVVEVTMADSYFINPSELDAGSHDQACSEVSTLISLGRSNDYVDSIEVTILDLKENVLVSLQVIDEQGNVSQCFSQLRAKDIAAPTAACKQDHVVSIPGNGRQIISAPVLDGGSTDNYSEQPNLIFSFDENEKIDFKEFTCDDEKSQSVTVWVWDEAGNKSPCEALIIIQDPLAICEDENATDIVVPNVSCLENVTNTFIGAEGEVTVWAQDFDLGSYDDQTDASNLRFSFEQVNNVPSLTFNCEDFQSASTYNLKMWVWDEAGNKEFCAVTLQLNDIYGICSDNQDIPPVATCEMQVNVTLTSGGNAVIFAENFDDGSLSPLGQNLTYTVLKTNPGSCDNDEFEFSNRVIFCAEDIGNTTVTMRVTDEDGRSSECDILVNVVPNTTGASCKDSGDHSLVVDDGFGDRGANVCIPVTGYNFDKVGSMQAAITWDTDVLSFTNVNEGLVTNGDSNESDGTLRFLWFDNTTLSPLTARDGDVLFEICFDVVGNSNETTSISIIDLPSFMIEITKEDNIVSSCVQEGIFTVN